MPETALTWTQVCEIPWLQDLPAKIETNRYGKIMMSPASSWHGGLQYDLARELDRQLPGGRILIECPIDTSDGTRVADVAWMSRERWLPHQKAISLPLAPEICVEILSPSNHAGEMVEKRRLYHEAGAEEVWLCDENGAVTFYTSKTSDPIPSSRRCPHFPKLLQMD